MSPLTWIRKNSNEIVGLSITLLLSIICVRALFHEGFFRTIDDITPVRLQYLVKELTPIVWDNFPVRFSSGLAHGFGYALYMFYGSLAYFIGALTMIFGHLSDIIATKLIFAIPIFFGPFIAYWVARQRLPVFAALIVTIIYAMHPFRGFDIYIRGGVGESWASMFSVLAIGGLFLIENKNKYGFILGSLSIALAILSHNISGILCLGFYLIYGIIFCRKNIHFWLSVLLGLGISSFFWLPAFHYVSQMHVYYSAINTVGILYYFTPISELLLPHLFKIDDKSNPFILYLLLLSLIIYIFRNRKLSKSSPYTLFWILSAIILYILPADILKPLWMPFIKFVRIIQFPWRLNIINIFVSALAIGYGFANSSSKLIKLCIVGLSIIYITMFIPAFKPKEYSYYYNYNAEDTGPCATTWDNEYLPVWVVECLSSPPVSLIEAKPTTPVTVSIHNRYDYQATLNPQVPTRIEINKYYYPGWHLEVDGQDIKIDNYWSKNGIIVAHLDPGEHIVRLFWTKTTIMWVGDILTLISILIWVGIFVYELRKK